MSDKISHMTNRRKLMHAPTFSTLLVHVPLPFLASLASAQTGELRTGAAALADWKIDAPGVRRHIKPSDLPAPKAGKDAEASVAKNAKVVEPPQCLPRGRRIRKRRRAGRELTIRHRQPAIGLMKRREVANSESAPVGIQPRRPANGPAQGRQRWSVRPRLRLRPYPRARALKRH